MAVLASCTLIGLMTTSAALMEPTPFSDVRLEGELGARYHAATYNLVTRKDRYSLESFAASATGKPGALWWDWPGDQIGRWLSVLHVAEGLGWTPASIQRKLVGDRVLPLQTPEGHFGVPGSVSSDDVRILSGNAFALAGLMHAHRDTSEVRYLEAAKRLAGYFETLAPTWEMRRDGYLHEFYGHCMDGLVALHEVSGEEKFLALAKRLAGHVGRTRHTHHSLSLYRGLVDLARVTGDSRYTESTEDYLAWCRESQLVTGGLPENLPSYEQDEGCALADWIVVNLMMFQVTGENRYLDDAEHMLVNHFAMHQFHTGGFGHRTYGHEVVGGKHWQGWDGEFGSENPGCCSLWGQWALGNVGRFLVTRAGETVHVNLYPSAEIHLSDPDVRLVLTGDFPRMSRVEVAVHCDSPKRFAMALRVPGWADGIEVSVAGTPVHTETRGGRVRVERVWQSGDTVELGFDAGLRLVPWPKDEPEGVGVFDGPLCLGLSSTSGDVDLPWAVRVDEEGKPLLDREGRIRLVGPSGEESTALAPIGRDWLSSDINDPNRLRILFRTTIK